MKKVVCINDRKLPEGAEVVNGREYEGTDGYVDPSFCIIPLTSNVPYPLLGFFPTSKRV